MSEHIYEDSDMENERYHVIPFGSMHEEIVRCRDCKHYDDRDAGCSYFVLAESKLLHIKDPDGFCKWGERREQ